MRAAQDGDWYLTATPASPIAAALGGLPVDSFPPAVQLTAAQPPSWGWVGLMAQAGRRGAPRPAFFGSETGAPARHHGDRWSLALELPRGVIGAGLSRPCRCDRDVALGAPETARGPAHPLRPVVANGRPLVFEWTGAGAARAVPIDFSGHGVADTLRFDGAGRAEVWLAPGSWRYRLEGGARAGRGGAVFRRAAAAAGNDCLQGGRSDYRQRTDLGAGMGLALRPRGARPVRRVDVPPEAGAGGRGYLQG